MIQHLLQLIWNQRKQNAWLWAELLLVSVFLWFLVDYLYVMGRTYTAPLGFDIRHTYSIVISSLSERSPDYIPKEKRERPDGVHLLTALDRIPHLSRRGIGLPYGWGDALLYGKP